MYLTKRFYEIPYAVIKNEMITYSKVNITEFEKYIELDIVNKNDLDMVMDAKTIDRFSIMDDCFIKYMEGEEIVAVETIKKAFSKPIYDIMKKRNILWYTDIENLLSSEYGIMALSIGMGYIKPQRELIDKYFNFLKSHRFIETMKGCFNIEFKTELDNFYIQNAINIKR